MNKLANVKNIHSTFGNNEKKSRFIKIEIAQLKVKMYYYFPFKKTSSKQKSYWAVKKEQVVVR